ncbi:hypothetical protein N7516_007700 [Penicillium verrucosum]|uniref:uncharacterized protein n=1 Tax=Penicillium verrucosum TaxID=60171 RepID=UPI002545563B|nr:uncharacterized protein N7516_007700 [Penicillium verrucosum]KAJ5933211.1 hypothetical protein N7516_007700 [Penicillium verrucosum]
MADAATRFTIDTKFSGRLSQLEPTEENIVKSYEERKPAVDVFYIHAPCRGTPVKTSCRESIRCTKPAIGLSNFNADEVEEVIRVAGENNFVIPSVYQGNYNAISRRTETELMLVLRKWNVALRSMHTAQFQVDFWPKPPNNSWTYTAKMYNALYNKPCMLKALAAFVQLSKDTGISQAELAYRWLHIQLFELER